MFAVHARDKISGTMETSKTFLFTSDTLFAHITSNSLHSPVVRPSVYPSIRPFTRAFSSSGQCAYNPARANAERRDAHFIGRHFTSANYFRYQWTDVVISRSAIKWTRSREFYAHSPPCSANTRSNIAATLHTIFICNIALILLI